MNSTRSKSPTPSRIRYFQGQKLTAQDMRDMLAYETRMYGMHLRGLHNSWGVALGFEVSLNKDRDTVLIGPGVAYDCHGRAIISGRIIQAGMPPLPRADQGSHSWVLDLVISYDDRHLAAGSVVCLGEGPSAAEERPAWRWVIAGSPGEGMSELAEDVRLGEEIPLARFVAGRDLGFSNPDFSHRRNAQGLVRPHVGSGSARVSPQGSPSQQALSVHVDTSAAGFTNIPHYFASLDSHPFLDYIDEDDPEQVKILRLIQGPFLTIRNATTAGFELDIRFALSAARGDQLGKMMDSTPSLRNWSFLAASDAGATLTPLRVNWCGIEDVSGCIQPLQAVLAFIFPFIQILPLQVMMVSSP